MLCTFKKNIYMKPFTRTEFNRENINENTEKYLKENPTEELWVNDVYLVNVSRDIPCDGIKDDEGKPVLITHLSIKRKDRSAKVDWRDFQYIKNELVGAENEGCELYPSESRLIDTANQFHIFCFQNTEIKFPFGFFGGRMVSEKPFINVTQRPFSYDRKPKDLDECENKLQNLLNQKK